jgi:hypothetical protein
MKKIILLVSLIGLLSACTTVQAVDLTKIHNDTYVICKSKLDGSELDYLKSQRVDIKSAIFPDFTVSNVTDINGNHVTVNQTEWLNYVCTQKVLP